MHVRFAERATVEKGKLGALFQARMTTNMDRMALRRPRIRAGLSTGASAGRRQEPSHLPIPPFQQVQLNTFMHPIGKGSMTMIIGKRASALARSAFATALAAALALTMLPSAALADTPGLVGGGSL